MNRNHYSKKFLNYYVLLLCHLNLLTFRSNLEKSIDNYFAGADSVVPYIEFGISSKKYIAQNPYRIFYIIFLKEAYITLHSISFCLFYTKLNKHNIFSIIKQFKTIKNDFLTIFLF